MPVDAPDLKTTTDALEVCARRFGALLEDVDDPGAIATGRWTIADVAAHLAFGPDYLLPMVEHRDGPRAESIEGITALNDAVLDREPERDVRALARRFDAGVADMVRALRASDPAVPLRWHGDQEILPGSLAGIALGEVLVHGYDVARAANAHWTIEPGHARIVFQAITSILPQYVRRDATRGMHEVVEVRLRGGPHVQIVIDDGTGFVEPAGARRASCTISAEPVAMLLVSYGRSGPVKPALTGKVVVWGRKPWLGVRLPALFESP
ncbi:MAG TPA: maleylpyruvate isomerase family mycothiol-dependent enzyme [Actinomycetota bacterium]|nr:maleylpyruvate isomerase family mycothiol-dependent enzyme [Actinomycetota bacterium]